jgi:hypothetical protein
VNLDEIEPGVFHVWFDQIPQVLYVLSHDDRWAKKKAGCGPTYCEGLTPNFGSAAYITRDRHAQPGNNSPSH